MMPVSTLASFYQIFAVLYRRQGNFNRVAKRIANTRFDPASEADCKYPLWPKSDKYSKPDYECLISSWPLISITTAKLPFTILHDYCILSLAFTILCNCSEPSHLLSIIKMDFTIHFAACYNRIAASQPDSVKFSSKQLQLSYRNQ